MVWGFIKLLLIAAGLLVFIAIEILDWRGRAEIIEKHFPGLWRFMNSRPARLILLVVAIGLLERDFRDVVATAPPPTITIPAPPAPPLTPKVDYRGQAPPAPSSSTQRSVENLIPELTRLADQGTAAQKTFLAHNDTEELKRLQLQWKADTTRFLEAKLGKSYALQFNNAHGSPMMGCPVGRREDGCVYWQDIEGKKDSLMAIVSEARGH